MEWTKEASQLFEEFLAPIPSFVRIMIKKGIKKKIEEVATTENATAVEQDHVIHGFILGTPKGSIAATENMLKTKNIDYSKYAHLFNEK